MEEYEREVLRELNGDIFEDLDPVYILPYLCKILPSKVFEALKKLGTNSEFRHDRVDILMEHVLGSDSVTLVEFCNALAFQNAYSFINDKIEDRLKQKHQNKEVYPCIKSPLGKNRLELVKFRHTLSNYSLTGKQKLFDKALDKICKKWKNSLNENLNVHDRQKLADLYFFARDAQCENMRLRYDTNILKSDVLSEILKVAPYTTNPALTIMMYNARTGSAMIMVDPSTHSTAFRNHIELAEQNADLVPACRETGNVFTIKYNFEYLNYERTGDIKLKNSLFRTAEKAIDHFCREYEMVAKDFRNIFMIKLSHLHLGIGVLGNTIKNAIITEKDLTQAKWRLNTIHVENLTDRWKWGYYIAKSKLTWFEDDLNNALKQAKTAYSYAVKVVISGSRFFAEDMKKSLALKPLCHHFCCKAVRSFEASSTLSTEDRPDIHERYPTDGDLQFQNRIALVQSVNFSLDNRLYINSMVE
ncbi:unnamed protein product [Mytilus coruscus]|uniref:Uncharacterized protein n=1 Tax=Mytilus coruscus TaxID=42192 RepID=A0A6J8E9Z8_MYTCO|nr:unnamed protein product [Mytilus coruscus]